MSKRRVSVLVGWIVATSLAMLLASQAVALVRDQVTDRPSRAATTRALETTTSTTGEQSGSSTTTTTLAETTTTSVETTTTTLGETTTTTQPEATTTSVTTTSLPDSSSTTTTTTANQEETFHLVGGWATIRCAGNEVTLATYSPNPGYQVDIESAGPVEVEVKFEEAGGDHRSKLEVHCNGGVLDPELEERDHD